jgi:hypothetical protein
MQQYVIKFNSDLRQVSFSVGTPVSSTNKTDRHNITEILMKVASIDFDICKLSSSRLLTLSQSRMIVSSNIMARILRRG